MRTAQVPDRLITQQVAQKLANRGIRSPCHVAVQTRNGDVTLWAAFNTLTKKGAATQVVGGIMGVRRVVDQLTVKAVAKR